MGFGIEIVLDPGSERLGFVRRELVTFRRWHLLVVEHEKYILPESRIAAHIADSRGESLSREAKIVVRYTHRPASSALKTSAA